MMAATELLQRARATVDNIRTQVAWAGPLLVRLAVGWTFMLTGWGKLHSLADVEAFFAQLGIPAPGLHAVLVSSIELVAGALILVGLGTRVAAALVVGVMTVALATAIWPKVQGPTDLFGTIEFVYLATAAWLALAGAGAASLDAVIGRWLGRDLAAAPASSRPTAALR